MTDIAIPLTKASLTGLVSNIASNSALNKINKFERRISGEGTIATSGAGIVRVGKRLAFFMSNEAMNDIIKIIKSLEDLGVLIGGVLVLH